MNAAQPLWDAGLTLRADGDRLIVRPATRLTPLLRQLIVAKKPEILNAVRRVEPDAAEPGRRAPPVDISPVAWTDGDIASFLDRRARLLRWGWSEADAEALAERLVIKDRERDERVSCAYCRHYRGALCTNHKAAGLGGRDVGRSFAEILQRCPGFGSREGGGA